VHPAWLGRAQSTLLQTTAPISRTVYSLVQDFARLLWTPRLASSPGPYRPAASTFLELEHFASGIQKDAAAVLGAIVSPWSNGQVEGQVTRVRMLKQQMYGRAKFDLL
jgi:transposase